VAAAVLIASAQTARGSSLLALALFGACAAWAILSHPRAGVLLLVVLVLTIFPSRLGLVDVGGIRTDPTEALAILLVASALLRKPAWDFPFRGPLLLLVLAFFVGALTAIFAGAAPTAILAPLKTSFFYLFALALAAFFPAERDKQFLADCTIRIAFAASAVVLASTALGLNLFIGRTDEVSTLGLITETTRLRPAVLSLVVVATLLIVARMTTAPATPWMLTQLAVFGALVVLSYTRSILVPLAVAALTLGVIHAGPRIPRRLIRNVLVITSVVAALSAAAGVGALGQTGTVALQRIQSVANPDLLNDGTYLDRESENASAVAALRKNPVFGVGLEQPYGAERVMYLENPPRLVKYQRVFIHNSFYGYWLALGLMGLVALGWLAARTVAVVRRARASMPASAASICLAGGLSTFAFAFAALFQPVVYHRPSILWLGMSLYFAAPAGGLVRSTVAPGSRATATV
jgi:hypothetical protein